VSKKHVTSMGVMSSQSPVSRQQNDELIFTDGYLQTILRF